MKLATWNVNSVRLRLDNMRKLVELVAPDVLCLQEIKVDNDRFPVSAFEELGYVHHHLHGQKAYHGVAIFSRLPIEEPQTFRWWEKPDSRHQAVRLPGDIELHNLYIPAGGDIPDPELNEKFAHKLGFLDEMAAWFRDRDRKRMILVGDLNIAPLETDVWSHRQLLKVVSHTPVEVAALNALRDSRDWVDAIRYFIPPENKLYSWWSYRARDWEKADRGRRLDHIWVTPDLKASLKHGEILRSARGWDKPSDHVPVIVDLST